MKCKIFIFAIFLTISVVAQNTTYTAEEISITNWVDGTLLKPNTPTTTLAIIIAGSGPTDRNGNQNFMKSNNLKKLAEAISSAGIATFRYDKRIVKQILKKEVDPNILFDDFISDANAVITYFKTKKEFHKIIVIGYSQGSLIGMIAAKNKADAFISLAGAGQSIDGVLLDQIEKTAPQFTEDTKRILNVLKSNATTSNYPPALASIFDISLQPFMQSWMQYNPKEEIKKLKIPILIINGTKDLQVPVSEAKILSNAAPKATLKIVENMNHVLFTIAGDDLENAKSYNESFRKINAEMLSSIIPFITNL